MRKIAICIIAAVVMCGVSYAQGEGESSGFERAIRPVSNPVFLDSPDVGNVVHPIYIFNSHPSRVNTTLGKLPADGDYQVYALQFEVKLADDLSLIAQKDGYIDFDPDDTFSDETGWGDLAAGLKWVFYRNEETETLVSTKLVVELPTGNDDVWQGNGDGTIDPAISVLKFCQKSGAQFIGTAGFIIPLDNDEESTLFNAAAHLSYPLTDNIFPLVELNYFRVLEEGDGVQQFNAHVDGGVPGVARFEGGDLVNFGAANADDNPDLVTLAVGGRVRVNESIDLGAAYEFPLTDDEDSLTDYRITVDAVWKL